MRDPTRRRRRSPRPMLNVNVRFTYVANPTEDLSVFKPAVWLIAFVLYLLSANAETSTTLQRLLAPAEVPPACIVQTNRESATT